MDLNWLFSALVSDSTSEGSAGQGGIDDCESNGHDTQSPVKNCKSNGSERCSSNEAAGHVAVADRRVSEMSATQLRHLLVCQHLHALLTDARLVITPAILFLYELFCRNVSCRSFFKTTFFFSYLMTVFS